MISSGDVVYSKRGEVIGMIHSHESRSDRDCETITLNLVSYPAIRGATAIPIKEVIFGIAPRKPYKGTIIGNVRIRYRNNDYAKVYIRDPYRIREFYLKDDGDFVTHGDEINRNERITPRTIT